MFRSLSQDVENDGNASNKPTLSVVTSLPFGAGRRRTRAQAKLDIDERREQLKRTREAMEAMNKRAKTAPAKPSSTSGLATPPRANKVVIGASFGGNLPVERTPTKSDARSPPSVRRMAVAPQVSVPSPGKMAATMKKEIVGVGENANTNTNTNNTNNTATTNTTNSMKTRRLPSRGIAQSSSSGTLTRKRMISFSPERAERPVNEEAERIKLQRNLKATEKLQLRLEGIPVRTPEKPTLPESMRTPQQQKPPSRTQTPSQQKTPHQLRPSHSTVSGSKHEPVIPSPPAVATATVETQAAPGVRSDTPPSQASESQRTLELHSDDGEARVASRSPVTGNGTTVASCKKELDFTAADSDVVTVETVEETQTKAEEQVEEVARGEEATGCLSQPSEPQSTSVEHSELPQEPTSTTTIGFGESSESFTSTSVIEDVGLFNCFQDVEFSGGVYGEGTDGKVSAAMVRGQKVAIKKAKPHEGFPEEEAKRRSAVELYYLRRVRNVPGFVQCLGLCDAIEHTCIALEVLDCKLSDYLRKYGTVKSGGGSSSSKRRCFTLSVDATRSMIKQICQPMMVLHDQVNVAHGDLACRNILLRLPPTGYEKTWEPVVKLSDFGRIKTPATEPPIFDEGFSFYKNCDVGSFAREILYRLLVGEIVPTNCTETRNLHKHLQDVVVERIPESAKEKLGPFYRLFKRCAGWGVRPTFREIVEHLDDLEYFETSDNGYFPLKPANGTSLNQNSVSLETASFLSPMMEGSRHKTPSSDSKNKYDTPATANARNVAATTTATAPASTNATSNGPRMLPGKSFTDGNGPGQQKKTVNWLKARSVHPGGQQITSKTTATSTPLGRPALPKKTPPSAGASRRSLQILNQIQHRQKEKKKC